MRRTAAGVAALLAAALAVTGAAPAPAAPTEPALSRPVLGAYNAAHDPDLGGDAGWTPTLRAGPLLPTPLVPLAVGAFAGAGRLPL
ncbi:hypothetical protein ACIBOV_05145 [Micromonospora chersina]|uniref:hypothetical protein n=1 Tax=Micromonospora chersina TaxID=47854 RepID=UPI00379F0C3D